MERVLERFLKPLPGLIVRDPVSKVPLSEDGEFKPYIGSVGRYWRRRVKDGSCFEIGSDKKSNIRQRKSEG